MRIMRTIHAGASESTLAVQRTVLNSKTQSFTTKYWLAIVMLIFATLFWGIGNVAQKIVLSHTSPFTLLFVRSIVACVMLCPLAARECKIKHFQLKDIVQNFHSLAMTAISFAMGLTCQTYGGQFTSATNLGFIINLCVLITPLLLFLFFGERVSRLTLLSCGICFLGTILLTGLHYESPNFGDCLCFIGAIFYGVWIIELDRTLKVVDAPILITVTQFIPTCLIGLALEVSGGIKLNFDLLVVWPALLFVCILSTCVSFLIAAYAQRLVKPVIAAMIYSFEALFGALAAFFFLGERLSPSAILGGSLMFASILFCQYRAKAAENIALSPQKMTPDEIESWIRRLNV
jgi:drug/metabolite transporter (DMT)-like permease